MLILVCEPFARLPEWFFSFANPSRDSPQGFSCSRTLREAPETVRHACEAFASPSGGDRESLWFDFPRILSYESFDLFVCGMGEKGVEMVCQPLVRFLWCAVAAAGLASEECLGSRQQRPAPAIFMTMTVGRVYEVLGNDIATHLQAGDIAVESAAHLGTIETTGGTQFAGDETAVLS